MIDPASLADWTVAMILASVFGGIALGGTATLREELEAPAS